MIVENLAPMTTQCNIHILRGVPIKSNIPSRCLQRGSGLTKYTPQKEKKKIKEGTRSLKIWDHRIVLHWHTFTRATCPQQKVCGSSVRVRLV